MELPSAVRDAAAALGVILPHAASLGAGVPESIQDAIDDVDAQLAKTEVSLAVLGEPAARRALMRLVLGEGARAPKARRERILRVRSGESFDYMARGRDGSVIRFARAMPDRDPAYRQSIEQAEERVRVAKVTREALDASVERSRADLRAHEAALAALDTEVETAGQRFAEAWRAHRAAEGRARVIERSAPPIPPIFEKSPPWWAVWVWVMRLILSRKFRPALAEHAQNRAEGVAARSRAGELEGVATQAEAARDDVSRQRDEKRDDLERATSALASVEVELAEEHAVAEAEAIVDKLLRERVRHAGERKEEFLSDLRDIDGGERGDSIDELDVELPRSQPGSPPPGIVLVFGADPDEEEVDGFVVARGPRDALAADTELRQRLPRVAVVPVHPEGGPHSPAHANAEVARILGRVAQRKALVVAARLGLRLRACMTQVARARSAAEVDHQRRLGALESQRIPRPDEFRTRQLARSEAAIDKGADDVLASTLARVQADFEGLRADWRGRIAAARGKRQLDAVAADVNQRGKLRVFEMLEATSEHVAREMQSVGESLERWALDEVQSSYRTQRRVRAESLSPVASEITGEELAAVVSAQVPIAGARETFERQRMRIGLAGAAAGAVAGTAASALAHTAVHPWMGAAIGAFAGVFAGFAKPSASLKAACHERADAYVTDVSNKVQALLRERRPDLARGIRSSLDDALRDTLERLNDAITRLLTIERNAIEGERKMLDALARTRGALEDHDARLRRALDAAQRGFDAP